MNPNLGIWFWSTFRVYTNRPNQGNSSINSREWVFYCRFRQCELKAWVEGGEYSWKSKTYVLALFSASKGIHLLPFGVVKVPSRMRQWRLGFIGQFHFQGNSIGISFFDTSANATPLILKLHDHTQSWRINYNMDKVITTLILFTYA